MAHVEEIQVVLLFNLKLKKQISIKLQDGFKLLLYMDQLPIVMALGSQVFLWGWTNLMYWDGFIKMCSQKEFKK